MIALENAQGYAGRVKFGIPEWGSPLPGMAPLPLPKPASLPYCGLPMPISQSRLQHATCTTLPWRCSPQGVLFQWFNVLMLTGHMGCLSRTLGLLSVSVLIMPLLPHKQIELSLTVCYLCRGTWMAMSESLPLSPQCGP